MRLFPPQVPEARKATPKPQLTEPLSSSQKLPSPPPVDLPKPQLTEPLSSPEKLPSPPPLDLPKPQPNIPDPAKYSLPEVAKRSGLKTPIPTTTQPKPKAETNSPQPTESTIATPKLTAESPNTSKSQPDLASTTSQLKPQDLRTQTNVNPGLESESKTKDTIIIETQPEDNTAKVEIEPKINKTELDSNSDLALNSPIPQASALQEIQAYFKEKWQPPEKLQESIEYRLILNSNGSIKRIIPIGKASEIYLDRTNIPLMGEVFISPLTDNKNNRVRLLLSPDGDAIAFYE